MISNDTPILEPKDDQFGIDPFAQAIARAIEKISVPEGTVLALTGPWGSGKSSAVNLVRHHLKAFEEEDLLKTIVFNPWWYADEQSLTRAFFQHLYSGLGKQLSNKTRRTIFSLGKKLLGSGPLVSSVADFFTFGIAGKVLESFSTSLAETIKTDRTVEDEFQKLTEELRNQKKRFLLVIDDIDRLTPEQAVLVFRLVKSVGRLPNVLYLLVFERELAERVLAERFPSEKNFLEKIVQAAFEMPLPDPDVLHEALLLSLVSLAGHPEKEDGVRFRNVLADVVNPLIILPRDMVRIVGHVGVSWAAVGQEVDLADLVAIEALRLFKFPLHQVIRSNKLLLCGTGGDSGRPRNLSTMYDEILLATAKSDRDREYLKTALRRLFPRLDSIWANIHHSSSGPIWRSKRLICDPTSFASYFRLALSPNLLPRHVIESLISNSSDIEFVKRYFREHSIVTRRDGQSDVPLIFEEMMGIAQRIPEENLVSLLGGIFEIADDLDIERDEQRGGFGHGTLLRMQWLLNAYVRDRLPQPKRNTLFRSILPGASLGWAVDLTSRFREEHWPRNADRQTPPELRFVDSATATDLIAVTLNRLRAASENGLILRLRHFLSILYRWREFSDGADGEVRRWTDAQMDDDKFVLHLVEAVTSTAWVSGLGLDGMGDRVSRGIPRVQIEGLETILDVSRFLLRVEGLDESRLNESEMRILSRFREGMQSRAEEEERHRSRNQSRDGNTGEPDTPEDNESRP